ncbi:MAG: DUF1292 domain-containing protein [Bacillota bacterium]|jgi:uncharacterized protein YrzB (UPF0473 family)|nr:DUF1292 domain-containing protein [Bacillota bacterium]HHT90212.1 DUF1292 domain-containing protein [Bacillota bacterium]
MSHNHDGHDHDHDHHEHDFEMDDTIVLVDDEDGTEHVFTVLEYLELDDQVYAVLLPEDAIEGQAYIFKVGTDENGEEILMDIEDDDEFDRVVAVLDSDEVD